MLYRLGQFILDFSFKAVSAALFGILLLLAFVVTAPMENQAFYGFFRYDYLLFFSVIVQASLLYFKLESWMEAKVIALFHIMALMMELVLTHPSLASWQYTQPAVFKLWTVPLFAGFMYSAVGSFLVRSIRLYSISFTHLPSFSIMLTLALCAYLNFMAKFFILDIRYLLFVWSFFIFWKTKVQFYVAGKQYTLPMLLVLLVLAFLIWLAENISTFYKIWVYPTQIDVWHMVGWGKLGSWYLLLLLSLVLVLKIQGFRDEKSRTWSLKV